MAHIAYFRVSSSDQSVESQRQAMLGDAGSGAFAKEFKDEGVSGAVQASARPGFAALLQYIREGDTLHVYAVDRLGRDALDVQATVRALLQRGVAVQVHGLGTIARGVGELILAVLAQVADMERQRIKERTAAGRDAAKKALRETGKTHRGKESLGRPFEADPFAVARYRRDHNKSIADAAANFGISESTVKRYCAAVKASQSKYVAPNLDKQRLRSSTLLAKKRA